MVFPDSSINARSKQNGSPSAKPKSSTSPSSLCLLSFGVATVLALVAGFAYMDPPDSFPQPPTNDIVRTM